MKLLLGSMALLTLFLTLPAHAELWVDQAAPAGGNGSPTAPCPTIQQALKGARPGEIVTVRKGVYREALTMALSGTTERLTTLRRPGGAGRTLGLRGD